MAKSDWCRIRDGGNEFWCTRCGGSRRIVLPCPISAWAKYAKAFEDEHKFCAVNHSVTDATAERGAGVSKGEKGA